MKFCDFFAGIGGFRLGLERAGHVGVWACEVDDFCRKIYAQHFEEPRGKDINDVKAEEIPGAEIWCGGFPCQDLSVAGKRGGLQANRSGLYWVWHELIRKRQPPWLLIENVPGLLSSKGGADFALILSSLDSIGYGVAWRVLDAQFFGLAQRRKRVFIVGRFGKPCPPEILFECEGGKRDTVPQRKAGEEITEEFGESITRSVQGKCRHDQNADTYIIAFAENQRGEIHTSNIGPQLSAGGGKPGQGYPAVIAPPPHTNGVREATGLSRRMDTPDSPRYKALGNAVAVPVVEWIGRRLPK